MTTESTFTVADLGADGEPRFAFSFTESEAVVLVRWFAQAGTLARLADVHASMAPPDVMVILQRAREAYNAKTAAALAGRWVRFGLTKQPTKVGQDGGLYDSEWDCLRAWIRASEQPHDVLAHSLGVSSDHARRLLELSPLSYRAAKEADPQ